MNKDNLGSSTFFQCRKTFFFPFQENTRCCWPTNFTIEGAIDSKVSMDECEVKSHRALNANRI